MDFWVGQWQVFVGQQEVGRSRISKVLASCAIREEWVDARGDEGQSLFYVFPKDLKWRQVVTVNALQPGSVKEKQEVDGVDRPAIRFQGTVSDTTGRSWLDRTTLTPLADSTVNQRIEISTDNGATWRVTFDAIYRPVKKG